MSKKPSPKIYELPEIPLRTDQISDEILIDYSKLNESNFKKMILHYDAIAASPIEYLITGTLAVLSGAAGKNFYFKISDRMNVYLNIWAVLVGASSITRKTTAINTVKYEYEKLSMHKANEFKKLLSEYQKEMAIAKDKKMLFDKPMPVRKYDMFPQDSTVESLTGILSNSDKGIIIHSEFGSFLQQMNRGYSGDAKQFFTHIYDVPEIYEITRATKESTLIEKPYISLLGSSVIDWVRENSSPSDLRTGFFARIIWSIRNKPDEHKANIALMDLKYMRGRSDIKINIKSIYEYLIKQNEAIELNLNKDAEELFRAYDLADQKDRAIYASENELSFRSRLVIYALKFAGLIALTDERTTVKLQDMQDGILLANYYKRNAERLLNKELNQTEFSRQEKRILDLIRAKGGQIQHSILLQLSNYKKKEVDEIISNLSEKEQVIKREQRNSQNKLVTFYQLPGFSFQNSKHNDNQSGSEMIEQIRDEFYKGFGHKPSEYELEAAQNYVNQFGIDNLKMNMKECNLRQFGSWKSFSRNLDSAGMVKPIKVNAKRFNDDDDELYGKPYEK